MADLAQKLVPVAEAMLDSGEVLLGCCVATMQRTFSGGMVAIAVSPRRMVTQGLDSRFRPRGEPLAFPPERIAVVSVENGIGGSVSLPSLIMEAVSVTVDITDIDGKRLRLTMMGSGGQVQHDGIATLLAYLDGPSAKG